jgi:hypothetical protein
MRRYTSRRDSGHSVVVRRTGLSSCTVAIGIVALVICTGCSDDEQQVAPTTVDTIHAPSDADHAGPGPCDFVAGDRMEPDHVSADCVSVYQCRDGRTLYFADTTAYSADNPLRNGVLVAFSPAHHPETLGTWHSSTMTRPPETPEMAADRDQGRAATVDCPN